MSKGREVLKDEKMRLLDESLMLIERLKKMRAVGASPRSIGIDPHILSVCGLNISNTDRVARVIKNIKI